MNFIGSKTIFVWKVICIKIKKFRYICGVPLWRATRLPSCFLRGAFNQRSIYNNTQLQSQ
jgi:hypothetical protein